MVRRTELSPLLPGRRARLRGGWGAALVAVGCVCLAGLALQGRSSSSLLQRQDPGEQLRLARQLWAEGSGLEYEGQLALRRARALAMQILAGNSTNGTLGVNDTNGTNATGVMGEEGVTEEQKAEAEAFLKTLEDRGVNVDNWPLAVIHEHLNRRKHNDSYLGPPDKFERPEESKRLEEAGVHVGRWFWDDKDYGKRTDDKYIDVYSTSGFNQHDTFNYDDWLHKKESPAEEAAEEPEAVNATGLNATKGTNATAGGSANGTAAPGPTAPAPATAATRQAGAAEEWGSVPGHKLKDLGLNVDDWLIFGHRKRKEEHARLSAHAQRQLRVRPMSRQEGMQQLRNIGDSTFRSLGDFLDDTEVGRSKTFYKARHA